MAAITLRGSDLGSFSALVVDLREEDLVVDFEEGFRETEAFALEEEFVSIDESDAVLTLSVDLDLAFEEAVDVAEIASRAPASLSLGDSSSTIICQRISVRIRHGVRKSSKKVNT
ncbi:MAG: hypothetical protein AAF357_17065 [Verrucomicrobiota bacterium]